LLLFIEQQVTLYPHRDENNWWTIYKVVNGTVVTDIAEIEYVENHDEIVLIHNGTPKRLHSHDHRPPMTDLEYHHEVR
jgi:dolichyl-phosphate-mannose-protein mannosyltransferase